MIVIAAALVGAVTGGLKARRRNGDAADIAQYAAGFGICFALLGLILTIALDKVLM